MSHQIPVLVSEAQIKQRIKEIGKQISQDYAGREPLRLVGALKGCFVFMADLLREITIPVRVDFMEISSYGSAMVSSGNVKITKDLSHDIKGEHVLIAEDIIDTGLTFNFLMDMLQSRGPASIEICSLLVKPAKMKLNHPIRYTGFEIDDYFVVGYGLDYKGFLRNLPYIGAVSSNEQLNLFDQLE